MSDDKKVGERGKRGCCGIVLIWTLDLWKESPQNEISHSFSDIPVSHKQKCPVVSFENWLLFKGKHTVNELSVCARKSLRNHDAQWNEAKTNGKDKYKSVSSIEHG